MMHARMTITHYPYPDPDQCGEDLVTHAVWFEPINLPHTPQWLLDQATRMLCADPSHSSEHMLPDLTGLVAAMDRIGAGRVTVLAGDYQYIEDSVHVGTVTARIADLDPVPFDSTVAVNLSRTGCTVHQGRYADILD